MTDKELLELAAKAAGYEFVYFPQALDGHKEYLRVKGLPDRWNPLTDDGDALRLASRLLIDLLFEGDDGGYVIARWDKHHEEKRLREDDMGDFPQATRRAITRAAAEIGKSMETK